MKTRAITITASFHVPAEPFEGISDDDIVDAIRFATLSDLNFPFSSSCKTEALGALEYAIEDGVNHRSNITISEATP